jgi:hypothetical protein
MPRILILGAGGLVIVIASEMNAALWNFN